jgi:hypothetical protein
MNLETIISHFGLGYKSKEMDLEIIIENYWEKFNILFPEVSKEKFIDWINEDYYGGWEDYANYNVAGRRELKMLYATIRAKKPKNILEIGTYAGDSTNHILLAAENNRKEGYDCEVTTVDITDFVGGKKLHDYPLNRKIISSLHILNSENVDFDFILQDGDHSKNHVINEINLFKKIKSLELVWSHDYFLDNKTIGKIYEDIEFNIFSERQVFKESNYNAGFQIGIIKKNP